MSIHHHIRHKEPFSLPFLVRILWVNHPPRRYDGVFMPLDKYTDLFYDGYNASNILFL